MSSKNGVSLSANELATLHETSMELLAHVGVDFYDNQALSIFRKNGAKVNGCNVTLREKQVMEAVAQAPEQFYIRARNPINNLTVGNGEPIFVPAYGAPFIMDENGRRQPTLNDYEKLVRLVDALPNQDMSGYLLVEPADVPACQLFPLMLYAGMVNSDKPYMGITLNKGGALQTMEMSAILFGEAMANLVEQPVTVGLVDSLSPLQYSADSSEVIITYAEHGQPLLITSLIMAGATGPVTLAGTLAQQNAEILAGITLAQLVRPGTPVIYGAASTIMDLRTSILAIGSPELAVLSRASSQMARLYGLPSRGGGSLTDAHGPDAQAGFESMLGLLTACNSGFDLILHASGILSSFLAVSYEKFVIDDEICGLVRQYGRGLAITPETLAYDVIAGVGPGGNFLEEAHTYRHCRTAAWQPTLCSRQDLESWQSNGRIDMVSRARRRWQDLLAEHEPPALDLTTARQLRQYVEMHSS
jgi:trimethylamine--corrinoid protein Co-methyltransferase